MNYSREALQKQTQEVKFSIDRRCKSVGLFIVATGYKEAYIDDKIILR